MKTFSLRCQLSVILDSVDLYRVPLSKKQHNPESIQNYIEEHGLKIFLEKLGLEEPNELEISVAEFGTSNRIVFNPTREY